MKKSEEQEYRFQFFSQLCVECTQNTNHSALNIEIMTNGRAYDSIRFNAFIHCSTNTPT